jgi:hypothetical protein
LNANQRTLISSVNFKLKDALCAQIFDLKQLFWLLNGQSQAKLDLRIIIVVVIGEKKSTPLAIRVLQVDRVIKRLVIVSITKIEPNYKCQLMSGQVILN